MSAKSVEKQNYIFLRFVMTPTVIYLAYLCA